MLQSERKDISDDQLRLLSEHQWVYVQIPLRDENKLALEAVPEVCAESRIGLEFFAGQLPIDAIDPGGRCTISFKSDEQIHVINAEIEKVVSDGELLARMLNGYSFNQQREYFRVDTRIFLSYWRENKDAGTPRPEPVMKEAVVNLSGGGIRFTVGDEFGVQERLRLKLGLDGPHQADVDCTGQVVRIERKRSGGIDLCLTFVDISPQHRERIISFCFAQQRQLLRRRIRVRAED